jgi:hypothetical protein
VKESAGRASAVTRTQKEAVDRAREFVHNRGGGELVIKGADGKIRSKDTIAPGNDPRGSQADPRQADGLDGLGVVVRLSVERVLGDEADRLLVRG